MPNNINNNNNKNKKKLKDLIQNKNYNIIIHSFMV